MAITVTIVTFMCTLVVLYFEAEVISAQCGDLPEEEKAALSEIFDQLQNKVLDSRKPCHVNTGERSLYNVSIKCGCSYPDGLLHIEEIILKGQDLAGVLPPSLAKLPYVNRIDLSRNYLSGTIPPEWASIKLEFLSVSVNRLSGPIPKYLGNITTLKYLRLEANQFIGSVPAELGKLVNLERFFLSANFLTGTLPMELNVMKKLIELRLSGNNFTGKLPSFQGLTNLQQLELLVSGFQGPIPSSISGLTNLTELLISDLNGGASKFPILETIKGLQKLILRSCGISGTVPTYFPNMSNLRLLYLTGNILSGPIPAWILNRDPKLQIDLSYNNFSESSEPTNCRDSTVNLFRSYNGSDPSAYQCLPPCNKDWYSFHVNCGGKKTKVGSTIFDDDEELAGQAKFIQSKENWGISMTGNFLFRSDNSSSDYVAINVSVLRVRDPNLYTTARLSPLSLTYYGRCLANGKYSVTLHFAEIVFRNNQSFRKLGRRIFDVYIQGERRLVDFDIAHEAGEVDKVFIKKFNRILVKNKILEIRFQFAGKGTQAVPDCGTYGL